MLSNHRMGKTRQSELHGGREEFHEEKLMRMSRQKMSYSIGKMIRSCKAPALN